MLKLSFEREMVAAAISEGAVIWHPDRHQKLLRVISAEVVEDEALLTCEVVGGPNWSLMRFPVPKDRRLVVYIDFDRND